MAVDPETWRNSRPKKRMGAGVLVRDRLGRALLVEPTYKSSWELPGGSVEADESPRTACVREVAEELGLGLRVGRLLCFEWQGPEPDRTESLMLVYDGGVLPDAAEVRLAADELASGAESPTQVWPEVPVVTISAPHQLHLSRWCLMVRMAALAAGRRPDYPTHLILLPHSPRAE